MSHRPYFIIFSVLLLALVSGCAPPPPTAVFDVSYAGQPFPPSGTTDVFGAVILYQNASNTDVQAVCQGFTAAVPNIHNVPTGTPVRMTYWLDKRTQGGHTCDELVPNYDYSKAAQAKALLTSFGLTVPATGYSTLLAIFDPRTGVAGIFGIPAGANADAIAQVVSAFKTEIVQSDITTKVSVGLSSQQPAQGQLSQNGPTNTSGVAAASGAIYGAS